MHGGDIYRNNVDIDFSVNVNPLGVPQKVVAAMEEALTKASNYPDISCERLTSAIGEKLNINAENVLCGNGASELIMAIVRYVNPKSALLLAPGFSGYIKALEAIDCNPSFFYLDESAGFKPGQRLLDEVLTTKPDIVFFCNPSNPTGVLLDTSYIEMLCKACKQVKATLVIDECFMELTGLASTCSGINLLQQFDNLLILRAFTKSFSLPGVRLGYLLCPNAMVAGQVKRQLSEWNVSVIAQDAGVAAMQETDYLRESVSQIKSERECLSLALEAFGMKVYPSMANYILFSCNEHQLYEKLLKKGILIRDCSDYEGLDKGFYRVAVRTSDENEQLIDALEEVLFDEEY